MQLRLRWLHFNFIIILERDLRMEKVSEEARKVIRGLRRYVVEVDTMSDTVHNWK